MENTKGEEAVDTLIGAATAILAKAYHAKEDDTNVR